MTHLTLGFLGILALFILLALRMPVGLAMALVGFLGTGLAGSWNAAYANLGTEPIVIATRFELVIIPLFVFMGNLATVSGMSRDLYQAAYAWFGHWRGGLASATIAACACFAALSGSSVASALTMGRVALPEMEKCGYHPRLATGCVAAGGTLGILIPPSTAFVIYAMLTEESIGRLFIAGILPGLLLTVLFMCTISIMTAISPDLGPPGERMSMMERIRLTRGAGAMVGIVITTIGGIYTGLFTATEAAGVGAFLSLLLALVRRKVTPRILLEVLLQTGRTTVMVFVILIGAHLFSPFLAITNLPAFLVESLTKSSLPDLVLVALIMVMFIVLGTFLEGFAILVLSLPIVFPIMTSLGYNPIWFGVVMVILLEMGMISPPVGINVFVVKGIAADVPMSQIFAGIMPFWLAMIVCVVILFMFPQIATYLPNTMFN